MNDQLIFNNYLLNLKSTIEVYIHGTLESTNKKPRETLKNSLLKTITMQGNTYDEMTKRSWYTVENIKSKEIEKVLTKVNSKIC